MISRKRAGNSNIIYAFTMKNVVMEKVLALACYNYARECVVTAGDPGFQEGVADTNQPRKKNLDFDLSYCIPIPLQLIEEICEQESVRVLTPQILMMP